MWCVQCVSGRVVMHRVSHILESSSVAGASPDSAAGLAGLTAFISGGSRGIGLAIATKLAEHRVNIVIAAKTAEPHPKSAAAAAAACTADLLPPGCQAPSTAPPARSRLLAANACRSSATSDTRTRSPAL